MSRPVRRTERAAWLAIPIVLMGVLVLFLGVGSLGAPRPELQQIDVAEVLDAADPLATYGSDDIRVVGWYANLDADCAPPAGEPADPTWLERGCPLRLLLAEQPASGASQAALEAIGLRLAAPTGEPFPPRPRPEGWFLMMEPLVVTGHFAEPDIATCRPAVEARCRSTLIVIKVDGLVH
jgi:hypothetical protein